MEKFQFHLQKVIDMKEKSREQVEWSYANILKLLKEERIKLSNLYFEKQQLENQLTNEQQVGISIIEINHLQDYLTYVDLKINNQLKQVKQTEQKLSDKKNELVELKVDEKIWNNYREKKFQEYLIDSNRTEQKEMDEMANYRSYY
ncbi:flagellar export protein FliJ [Tepidibacillus marianensis]|uniref:flagellar export protein FliJ n=1 Tax=Tepidibacillus marianensis TaxID=3131995 RepID=UPI0030CC79A7